ncbi:MAG: hypothetical protein EZS28_046822, partial [Streblomastix strix]
QCVVPDLHNLESESIVEYSFRWMWIVDICSQSLFTKQNTAVVLSERINIA